MFKSKYTILLFLLVLSPLSSLLAATTPSSLLGYVKFPPPKTFTEKAMGLARAVQPGQQTEMLPMFLLGGFGYPNYPGISETENMTVFFIESPQHPAPQMVILGKVSAESNLRQSVKNLKWVVEDRQGWVLLARTQAAIDAVTDIQPLIKVNGEKGDFDVEARVFVGKERTQKWANELKSWVKDRHTAATGGAHEPIDVIKKQRFIDFAALTASNLEWVEIGVNITPDTVTIGSAVKAAAGTPEASFLSSAKSGKVGVGQLLTADGMFVYQGLVDNAAMKSYSDVQVARAESLSGEKGKAWLTQYQKLFNQYLALGDGSYAGKAEAAQDGENKSIPDSVNLYGGKFTDKAVLALAKPVYNELLPDLFTLVPYLENLGMGYTFEFTDKVGEVDGLPVHKLTTKVTVESPIQATAAGHTVPKPQTQTEDYFFTVVEGKLLTTSSMEALKPIVSQVKAGQAVENSISDMLGMEGDYMQYQVNIAEYMGFMSQAAEAQATPGMAGMDTLFDRLAKAELAPAKGAVSLGQARVLSTLSIPVSSIAKIAAVFQQVEAEKAIKEQNAAGDAPQKSAPAKSDSDAASAPAQGASSQ